MTGASPVPAMRAGHLRARAMGRLTAVSLLLLGVHVGWVNRAEGMEVQLPGRQQGRQDGVLASGLRGGISAKRSRSPRHVLEREGAEGGVRMRISSDPQVIGADTGIAAELPWRTPSPANPTSSTFQQSRRSWNSASAAESEPVLSCLDDKVESTMERSQNGQMSGVYEFMPDPTEESEEAFLFHDGPGSHGQTAERAGWAKMDEKTAQELDLTGKMPVAVDRDSRALLKQLSLRHERTGRAKDVRGIAAAALLARADRLARETNSTPGMAAAAAESDWDSDGDSEPNLSKVGVLLRGVPYEAHEGHVLEALGGHGEVETVVLNRAMGFAHVLFRSADACTRALRRKSLSVMDAPVDLVRGPNSLGTTIKTEAVATKRRDSDVGDQAKEHDSYLASRIVGKADDLTFGTGIRRAQYWVHRELVEGDASAADVHNVTGDIIKDENAVTVYNLPHNANETKVRGWFSRCGAIKQVAVHDIMAGSPRYALVEFVNKLSADEAVANLDGCVAAGPLCCAVSVPCLTPPLLVPPPGLVLSSVGILLQS